MTPWTPVQPESALRANGWESRKRLQFFSFFFHLLLSFSFLFFISFFHSFFLSLFCCFVFHERVSLCILGCPKTHSVSQAILDLTEICVRAEIKGMHRHPHTTARPRLQFLVISGCPGVLGSEDGSVLWMFVNPDYDLPFNDMSLKHQAPTPIHPEVSEAMVNPL